MTFGASPSSMNHDELLKAYQDLKSSHRQLEQTQDQLKRSLLELQRSNEELTQSRSELARQVEWFRRQLFGSKSERRIYDELGRQLTLGELRDAVETSGREVAVAGHRRRRTTGSEEPAEPTLRFEPSVPVEEIIIGPREAPEGYARVGEKVTERLAQRPGSYVVLRYIRPVYKRKADGVFSCPPAPAAVLEKSYADVSFLAGMLIDKFVYHIPLYRQHQRLEASGIHVSRSSLTQLVHRSIELVRPICAAQLQSILASSALAMDETPIKAGHRKGTPPHRGTMKTGYFWPIYGDQDEIAFPFAPTRGSEVVRQVLKDFGGVLLTDGYKPYEQYAQAVNRVVHAQCWAHTRRHFAEAEPAEPVRCGEFLKIITELYRCEKELKTQGLTGEKALAHRGEHAKPIVDRFFAQLHARMEKDVLLPSNPFTKAASYALAREPGLRVFLEYPNVPLDTNHLERAIRPVAIGRRNWLFCWTEVGAEYAGIIQSLLSTCRVQGIDPYTYLVDVLQRVDTHPAKDVALLTPRRWKVAFGEKPLRSDLDRSPVPCHG